MSIAGLTDVSIYAQKNEISFSGTVVEKKTSEPLPGATVQLPQYGLWAISDVDGRFVFKSVPSGGTSIVVRMVGMVTFDSKINPADYKTKVYKIEMDEESFGLNEVIVTATNNRVGASTASSISRSAIDHLQATSLTDIMELLPGQSASNPTLSSPGKAIIRQIQSDPLNSLGTSLVINGSPVSNNANLQIGNTASEGGLNTNFTSTAGSGTDMRQVSVDNIESVDVIRGIPSVEYGDLTSGVIIVNPKAGEFPWQVRSKINPTLTQASIGKGFNLGEKRGKISFDADYASSLNDERRPYQGYSRITTNILYSKNITKSITSTTGVGFGYDIDAQKLDPSDTRYQRKRSSKNSSFKANTNIMWNVDKSFLKYFRLNLSANYAIQDGYYQELKGNFGYMVTTSTKDNCITSNVDGIVENVWGTAITNNHTVDPDAKTNFLPYEFLTKSTTKGKPLNVFVKVTAGFLANFLGFSNRMIAGADWKTDVNFGKGVVFDPLFPPKSGVRMRPFSDIPALNQLGVFAEENAEKTILGRKLKLQAGVRTELIQPTREERFFGVSPRLNLSYELIPNRLSVRGGWGIAMKAPPLMYLYPDKAYFDFLNYDNIATTTTDSPERLCVITTKVFDTENKNLKIAKNTKSEVGLDFTFGQIDATVTAYNEKLVNGYSFSYDASSFQLFEHIKYSGEDREGTYPVLSKNGSNNVVLSYYRPLNNKVNENKGVEFDVNFGQIKSIHTTFVFNGAYMNSRTYTSSESYFQKNPDTNGKYKDIGIYASGDGSRYDRFLTTLRVIHNIPKISLLVSLSMQTIWSDSHRYLGLDNLTPYAYLSASDLSYHDINPGEEIPSDIQKQILQNRFITDSYDPLFLFNLRLTKEMKKWGGFAFL
jgi:Outer membrane receptor for ferrienterochelin and colicins